MINRQSVRLGFFLSIIVFCAIVWLDYKPSFASSLEDRIDALLDRRFDPNNPGVAVLVKKGSIVIYSGGQGVADLEKRTPITEESVFDLASVSKHFTAGAILLLLQEGKLDLDKPVADYIKEFSLASPGRPVKVRDLIYHTSGIPDYTSNDWKGSDQALSAMTNASHVLWLNKGKFHSAPGAKFEYNNSGYALLARIVEVVSGQTFPDFMNNRFYQPLEMQDTFVYRKYGQNHPKQVKGYKKGFISYSQASEPLLVSGDGNIFSNLNDLARWDDSLRKGTILKRESLRLAWTPGRLDSDRLATDEKDHDGYGFGWFINNREHFVYHSGSWAGTASYYFKAFDDDLTIIALSNEENQDLEVLVDEIDDLLK
ncbi:MAG: beta-lactamase family protein [Deltaproteobacteria bacterium]|nr:beta-lactamase family protein [Deltaproteobacteria bacterium]